jgi:hypothetical protein
MGPSAAECGINADDKGTIIKTYKALNAVPFMQCDRDLDSSAGSYDDKYMVAGSRADYKRVYSTVDAAPGRR